MCSQLPNCVCDAEQPRARPCISLDTAELAMDVHWRRASPEVGEPGTEDDIRFLALAMAGEAGEAANVVKKAWRDGYTTNRERLAEEIAGTACYLIGLAYAINLDLDAEMKRQMASFEARYETRPLVP